MAAHGKVTPILAVGGVVCIAILAILYVKSRNKANALPEPGTFELVAPRRTVVVRVAPRRDT